MKFESLAKWTTGVAGLCLLCCAAPLTLAFLGGGTVAAAELLEGKNGIWSEIIILGGLTIMALSGWAILARHRRNCNSCDIK